MPDDNTKKPGGEFDGKTYVYIRTNPVDDGTTPLASGLGWYLSPDITVIRPGGVSGTQAVVGEAEQVEVAVTNGGDIDAIDAHVEVFVSNPSTAFTPATATRVGDGFLTIPNNSRASIAFPWVPASSDAGHRCLLARVCLGLPFDCYANAAVFDVPGDRHEAQRNISVVDLGAKATSFGFLIVNPLSDKGAFMLRTTEVRPRRNIDIFRKAIGCEYTQFGEAPVAGFGLTLGKILPSAREPGLEKLFPTGPLARCRKLPRQKTVSLEMKKGEIRHAVLTIGRNPDIRTGDLNIVQVEQVDVQTKKIVGGSWIVVRH